MWMAYRIDCNEPVDCDSGVVEITPETQHVFNWEDLYEGDVTILFAATGDEAEARMAALFPDEFEEVEFEDEDEMTPEEFLRETGLAPDEDADRAYTDFLDHNDQNLSFADWWAEHQGDYV